MDHKKQFYITIAIATISAIIASTNQLFDLSHNYAITITTALTAFIAVNIAYRISFLKGRTNKMEFTLKLAKNIIELLILTSLFNIYQGFAPTTTYYLSIILVTTNFLLISNSKKILGTEPTQAISFRKRTTILIITLVVSSLDLNIGFYLVLTYLLTHIYLLYKLVTKK